MEKINIYQKMQKTIVELQSIDIKKSGSNNFAKFKYLELTDFLPALNELLLKNGLYCKFSFYENKASLKVYEWDSNGFIEFESPIADVKMKGVQEIQNLGAIHTYMRRYLYVLAFAICENDVLDAVVGQTTQTQKQAPKKQTGGRGDQPDYYDYADNRFIDSKKIKTLINLAENHNQKEVIQLINSYGYEKSNQIKEKDFNTIMKKIEKLPKKEG